jgi:general secretion pathway protein D
MSSVQQRAAPQKVRDFLRSAGIDFPSTTASPDKPNKAMYFNGQGVLYVRATMEELDTIEKLIQILNNATPPAASGEVAEASQLFTRTFKVDPNTFFENLRKNMPKAASAPGSQVEILREFLTQLGIGLPTNNVAGSFPGGVGTPAQAVPTSSTQKALFFNERSGIIFVRATRDDLDVIEQAIQVLNWTPPQVTLDVKLVEITEPEAKALGFDWFLGPIMVTPNTPAQKTNAPAMSGVFPGIPPEASPDDAKQKASPPVGTITGILTDPQFRTAVSALGQEGNPSNPASTTNHINQAPPMNPPVATLTGALKDPQFRALLRALEQRAGVDILSMPKVTTLSGRQEQLHLAQSNTVTFDFTSKQAPGVQVTKSIPVGPTVDITPTVSADGESIQLTIAASVVEFLGYDDPGPFRPRNFDGNVGVPLTAALPIPRFRLREISSKATVRDGETLVLRGFVLVGARAPEDAAKIKDKIPVLGDIPLLGRFFRSETNSLHNKQLILFITPTIIDPAGNRVHTESNRRFDPNTVPAQPPQK